MYGLENDAQEERELFPEERTFANNGWSLWKKLLLLFLTAVMAAGGTWFLYGWSVLRKMWVYGAAGGGIAILGTVLLHMMRGKVRGLLPGKYGGTGVKKPENSWQVECRESRKNKTGISAGKNTGICTCKRKDSRKTAGKTIRGTSGRMSDHAAYCKRGAGSYAGIGRRRK